jgi:serpin B
MRHRIARHGLSVAVLGLVVLACSLPGLGVGGGLVGSPSDGVQVVKFPTKRNTSPSTTEADVAELVAGNTAFAFDLYQAVRGQGGNLIYSPYSISVALAMTYAGARGETERQMEETLHYTLGQASLHPAFNALDLDLARRAEETPIGLGAEGQRFKLNIANTLWGQQGFGLLPDFLGTVGQNYDAGMQLLDFAEQPEEARLAINDWVADKTEDRIRDIVPPGAITPDTRLVLASAIYFNASWLSPFDEAQTSDEPFTLLDGSQVMVPMMTQQEDYGYARGDGYQAVELPYIGQDVSMIVILPDEGRFEEFEDALDTQKFAEVVRSLSETDVILSLPRFEFETSLNLGQTLAAMGMPDAFDRLRADFSGITDPTSLFISEVLHKAFVKVDESGTEAAAATVGITGLAAAPMPVEPIEVKVDRPFIFAIYDRQSDSVLFLGRVLNPEG